jgi:hypothetical protein
VAVTFGLWQTHEKLYSQFSLFLSCLVRCLGEGCHLYTVRLFNEACCLLLARTRTHTHAA